jgi:fibro-slime domain-containing protein
MKAIIAFLLLTFVLGSFGQSSDTLVLNGNAYDFANVDSGLPQANHDFNNYGCGVTKGMVQSQLGDDNRPVLADTKNCVDSKDSFYMWFRETDGENIVIPVTLTFYLDAASGAYKYRNNYFFPLDNQGYGNEGKGHNYGFCFELHTSFTYESGQVFEFMGDDDVWVFIDKKLVIDLGGVHGSASDSVNLDSLGLTLGQSYQLDFFFCERHVTGSNLVISTSIKLDPCGTVDTDGDGVPDLCDACPKGDMDMEVYADDVIGPDNTVTFHIALTAPIVGTYTVNVAWGDDSQDSQYEVSNANELVVTHSYDKTGEYNVYFNGVPEAGCGTPGPTESLVVTCSGGKRLAPKCSQFSVVPGTPTKRKRSL